MENIERATVFIPVKGKKDKFLVVSNPGIGGLISLRIDEQEILIPGPSLVNAINVVQCDQQFSGMDFDGQMVA